MSLVAKREDSIPALLTALCGSFSLPGSTR